MADIEHIFPSWSTNWAILANANALVRSQCRECGIQQRVDAGVQVLRFGGDASPVDALDRCTVVGCHGSVYFLVSKTYGRQWVPMLSREDLRASSATAAPPANAITLGLVRG